MRIDGECRREHLLTNTTLNHGHVLHLSLSQNSSCGTRSKQTEEGTANQVAPQSPCLIPTCFPDEEEEEENLDDQDEQGNLKGFINDDDDEEEGEEDEGSDSGDSEDDVGHKKRKRSE